MAQQPLHGLTPRQERALLALLNESTVLGAANACGVPERTIHRWMREYVFKSELRRLRREAFKHAVALAQRYAPMATTVLAQIVRDSSAPHSAKVAAAQALLKFGRESIELDDLAERIETLEEQQWEELEPPSPPPPV